MNPHKEIHTQPFSDFHFSLKHLSVILLDVSAASDTANHQILHPPRTQALHFPCSVQVLLQALVISWLDNCNSLLAGLPACSIQPPQRPFWLSTYLSSPTLHRSSTPCTGYWWLLKSDSCHWNLPTVLRTAQTHSTSRRTWSDHATHPVHYAPLLPHYDY